MINKIEYIYKFELKKKIIIVHLINLLLFLNYEKK